jgi:predicted DNA-binding protein
MVLGAVPGVRRAYARASRGWKEPWEIRVDLRIMGDPVKRRRRKTGAGGADSETVEQSRPSTVLIAFRVPPALAERLDKLAAELSTPWHEMKRSELARAALERGLDALEQATAEQKPLG